MRKLILTIWLTVLSLFGCGSSETENKRTIDYDSLEEVYDSIRPEIDSWGFVETSKCDSLLFTGMISAGGWRADLVAAEYEPGRWYRRPVDYPECWSTGASRSTISRDMLLGVFWHAWTHQDLGMLERLWDYGEENFWRMGDGRLKGADTIMNTAMISTLAQLIYALGGENRIISRNLPVTWSYTLEKDQFFINRLTALHLILRREAYGELSSQAESVLITLANTYPDNPLFLYAAGRHHTAANYLRLGLEHKPSGIHSQSEYTYEWIFTARRLLDGRD